GRQQCTGVAGLVAGRLRRALGLEHDLVAVAQLLAVHPAFLPRQYVSLDIDLSDGLVVRLDARCAAAADGGWRALLDEEHLEPLDAIVRTVDPRYRCVPRGRSDDIAFEVVLDDVPAAVAGEVELARISTGA